MPWLAICSKKDCRWDHPASSQISALVYAHGHLFERIGTWNHHVFVVEITDEPPPAPADTSRDPATEPASHDP